MTETIKNKVVRCYFKKGFTCSVEVSFLNGVEFETLFFKTDGENYGELFVCWLKQKFGKYLGDKDFALSGADKPVLRVYAELYCLGAKVHVVDVCLEPVSSKFEKSRSQLLRA